ncbi:MAG: 4Fe-4S binding protein, partial [Acidobacteriia bacterium]|nr:4Fe-4S binding protein [Terriglobia bacterium]
RGGTHAVPATPPEIEADSRARITFTPIPKLDGSRGAAANEPFATPLARIPHVDEEECVGCNLCALVCPVDGCITMGRVDHQLPPRTWQDVIRQDVDQALSPANPKSGAI